MHYFLKNMTSMQKLKSIYEKLKYIPYSNLNFYYRKKAPTINEIGKDIKNGLGADCVCLSFYVKNILEKEGFDVKFIHFFNKNYKNFLKKDINNMYHTSLVVKVDSKDYLIDHSFNFNGPIEILKKQEVKTMSHIIKLEKKGNLLYLNSKSANDNQNMVSNLSFDWEDIDNMKHLRNVTKKHFNRKKVTYAWKSKDKLIIMYLFRNNQIVFYSKNFKDKIEIIDHDKEIKDKVLLLSKYLQRVKIFLNKLSK